MRPIGSCLSKRPRGTRPSSIFIRRGDLRRSWVTSMQFGSAWQQSAKRNPLFSSKYYFFDVGVVGTIQGREFFAREHRSSEKNMGSDLNLCYFVESLQGSYPY